MDRVCEDEPAAKVAANQSNANPGYPTSETSPRLPIMSHSVTLADFSDVRFSKPMLVAKDNTESTAKENAAALVWRPKKLSEKLDLHCEYGMQVLLGSNRSVLLRTFPTPPRRESITLAIARSN